MTNITLSVDEAVVKQVRRVALERDTTLTAMVRQYLEQVASAETAKREQRTKDLMAALDEASSNIGGRNWKRDDLYD